MPSCSACNAANVNGARFCSTCGKPMASAVAAPVTAAPVVAVPVAAKVTMPASLRATGLRMCGSCGANIPPVLHACTACQGAVSQSVSIPYPPQGTVFVQVLLKFGCTQCGTRSAIDTLDADGRFFCFGCGQDRLFDTDMWKEKLIRIAAIVGDAFWTNVGVFPAWPPIMPEEDWLDDQDGWDDVSEMVPRLMADFLPKVGLERARLTMEQEGTVLSAGGMKSGTYDAALYPGHPLCGSCKTPLEIGFASRGVAQVRCRPCNVDETHLAPPSLLGECPELLAAIAPDLVQGRAPARVEAKAGTAAMAILCPQCGSSLSLPHGTRVAVCAHCKTSSMVPERAIGTVGKAPAPQPWWLCLYAPSSLRNLLAQPGAGRHRDDDDDDDDGSPTPR